MTKINPNKLNAIKTKGMNKMEKAQETLENKAAELVEKLKTRAEREVPEYGPFKLVYEDFKNPDKHLIATDFMLKISKPEGLEDEKLRFLQAVAYNLPSPYIAERVVASGDKAKIMEVLKSENLKKDLPDIFKKLSKNLEDI